MKLSAINREGGKGQLNSMRQQGKIPAVLYVRNGENKVIAVDKSEFEAILRQIKKGFLATTQFELQLDGKSVKAIVKDIHYHRTSYRVLHLDFQELYDDVEVNVNIPLDFTGVAECVGIKLGGFLRPVKRNVRVRCLPKDIPGSFPIDVSQLGIKQTKRVRDLDVSDKVSVLAAEDNVLVVIAK